MSSNSPPLGTQWNQWILLFQLIESTTILLFVQTVPALATVLCSAHVLQEENLCRFSALKIILVFFSRITVCSTSLPAPPSISLTSAYSLLTCSHSSLFCSWLVISMWEDYNHWSSLMDTCCIWHDDSTHINIQLVANTFWTSTPLASRMLGPIMIAWCLNMRLSSWNRREQSLGRASEPPGKQYHMYNAVLHLFQHDIKQRRKPQTDKMEVYPESFVFLRIYPRLAFPESVAQCNATRFRVLKYIGVHFSGMFVQ